jgi:bacterial/archaeal transporter family protein
VSDWLMWALLSACFAGLTAVLAKVGVAHVDPDTATFIRTCVILIILAGIVVGRGRLQDLTSTAPRTFAYLALSGVATGASWLCYFRALAAGDAARVAPIDKLSVVLVAIFSVLFLGEKLSAANWAGVAMIALGAWLLAVKV